MSLGKDLREKTISDLALRKAVRVPPDLSVREAVARMQAEKLGCVIVVDADDRPTGMFTENILVRLLIEQDDPLSQVVGDHTSPVWKTARLDDPVVSMLEAMQSEGVRFFCVVDDQGRATGLTGQRGLLEFICEHVPRQVHMPVRRIGRKPFQTRREGA